MIKLEKRELVMLLVLALILIGFAYYQLLWRPLSQQIIALQSDNASLEIKLTQAQQQQERNEALLAEKKEITEQLQRLQTAVPPAQDVPGLVTFLETAADQSNCRLESLVYDENQSELPTDIISEIIVDQPAESNAQLGSNNQVRIVAIAHGSYGELRNLITTIENSERIISLGNINITAASTSRMASEDQVPAAVYPLDQLTLNVEINAYYNASLAEAENINSQPVTDVSSGKKNPFR